MKTFDFYKQTVSINDYKFPTNSNQKQNAIHLKADRILYWNHDSRGKLPKYVLESIQQAGYTAIKIGYTTYASNTFALIQNS